MLKVRAVPRSEIDQWPIPEAGLPVRVVNSVTAAGVNDVGTLRAWKDGDLLRLRSLGRISLEHIHEFFKLCDQISAGSHVFKSVEEILKVFLDEDEMKVLSARYGLRRPDLKASRNYYTLQRIGNESNRTRERVRQVEESAKAHLRARLAEICFSPFIERCADFMGARGRCVSGQDLSAVQNDPALATFNPCSLLLLVSDLFPERITFYNGFFSTLPPGTLCDLERRAVALLDRPDRIVALDELLGAVPRPAGVDGPTELARALSVILDHHAGVGALTDGRYFLFERAIVRYLLDLLAPMPQPIHYRAVTSALNERLKPGSRKGSGYVLKVLSTDPRFVRADRGRYRIVLPGASPA